MSTRPPGIRPNTSRPSFRARVWALVLLFQFACATALPPGSHRTDVTEAGLESATEYAVDFLEPGGVVTRPVPLPGAEFQRALQRLAADIRLGTRTPRQTAHELMKFIPEQPEAPRLAVTGYWTLEHHRGEALTWIPERQEGPVALTPEAEVALKAKYLQWCGPQGGGDCLGLLDDGATLRADDRRVFALALAFGSVLDETRDALRRELLSTRALVSMVVWTVALYCMMWMVPEPTTKAIAAGVSLLLMGYLGLQTLYGLMDGWARLAETAYHATTFEELRAAGAEFGQVLGEDSARAMILAVATLSGHTLGQMAARVKSLPRLNLAERQFAAQGGAAMMGRLEVTEAAVASEGALARAVAVAETVATSPQGPLAVVMLKTRQGGGREQAPGGRSAETVIHHRGGNRQVALSDGQRWHLPRGKSAADIPTEDKMGDMLQEAVTRAAREWGPDRLSFREDQAISAALERGEYWLARLLEREARGRFVHAKLEARFKGRLQFNHQGVDVVDLANNRKYEILSGTESNLALHGRRMAAEFFRMLTF